MKVLLIWEVIPEQTILYSLEGELAELAITAAGHYINCKANEAVEALSDRLHSIPKLGDSEAKEAFDISGHDKVVICGFIM